MAIKSKSAKAEAQSLPAPIEELVKKGFTEQQLSGYYKDQFESTKDDALRLIEASDDVTIEVGTALKTEYGSINLIESNRRVIDKDKIIELVESGKISVAEILSCVSTYKIEDLEKAMSTALFKTVATDNIGKSFTWKIAPDFKAKCEAAMATPVVTATVAAVKPATVPKDLAREVAKTKAASIKSKLKSVDEILKGK